MTEWPFKLPILHLPLEKVIPFDHFELYESLW